MNITQIYSPNIKNVNTEFNAKISIDELNTIPNGSLDNIYCDILDSIEISKRINIQNELMKKVKIGGSIQLKIIHTTLLAKKIISDNITMNDLNNVVNSTSSVMNQEFFNEWINQYGNYTIQKMDLDDLYANVTLKRIQ